MGQAFKLSHLYGDLPLHQNGLNKNRLDRKIICEMYSFTYKEVTKAYLNWQDIFRFDGSNLTFKQYLDKLVEMGLTPSNVGNDFGFYNLSRYNDVGCYSNDNCRFITREENLEEQHYG
jgi:hypothetical protein